MADAPAPRPDRWQTLYESLSGPLPESEGTQTAPSSRDPIARGMTWAAEQLPEATPGWVRTVGRAVIPQTAPEAALFAATLPLGGPVGATAARLGLQTLARPALSALSRSAVLPFLARTGLTAGATSAVGAATGYDPLSSGIAGAVGRVGGEAVGKGAQKIVQAQVFPKLLNRFTGNLAGSFRETIGRWLPEGASDERVLQSVLADEPSELVGKAMNQLRARQADARMRIEDLRPRFREAGVTVPEATVEPINLGMVWPPTREFEKRLTSGAAPVSEGAAKTLPPGQRALPEPPMAMVRVGDVYTPLAEARQETIEALAHAQTEPTSMALLARLRRLSALEAQLDDRLPLPVGEATSMSELRREFARTKTLRNWLWGTESPAGHGKGAKAVETLFDKGRLSMEGYRELTKRFYANDPSLRHAFAPHELNAFGHALNLDLAHGAVVGEAGGKLTDLIPSISMWPGGFHAYSHARRLPGPGYIPGWEASRNWLQRLAPGALRAVTGAVPAKALHPRPEEE